MPPWAPITHLKHLVCTLDENPQESLNQRETYNCASACCSHCSHVHRRHVRQEGSVDLHNANTAVLVSLVLVLVSLNLTDRHTDWQTCSLGLEYLKICWSTVQYSAVQNSIVQYRTVQCSTEQYEYSTVESGRVQYAMQYRWLGLNLYNCWGQQYSLQYCTVLYSTVQYCTVLYRSAAISIPGLVISYSSPVGDISHKFSTVQYTVQYSIVQYSIVQ